MDKKQFLQHLSINKLGHKPMYKQLSEGIAKLIKNDTIKQGDKLPSINEISRSQLICRATVEAAYQELSNQKLIIKSRGKGHFAFTNEI